MLQGSLSPSNNHGPLNSPSNCVLSLSGSLALNACCDSPIRLWVFQVESLILVPLCPDSVDTDLTPTAAKSVAGRIPVALPRACRFMTPSASLFNSVLYHPMQMLWRGLSLKTSNPKQNVCRDSKISHRFWKPQRRKSYFSFLEQSISESTFLHSFLLESFPTIPSRFCHPSLGSSLLLVSVSPSTQPPPPQLSWSQNNAPWLWRRKVAIAHGIWMCMY